ncbi:hypothetical protein ABI59_10425 [Acidobacteria bacterium Mor1]|nr:hypothetical protein ABI59_10425 [Acidobacteria bacterium Mor1]
MKALVGLGSNLGDRDGHLRQALELLQEQGMRLRAASSIWETGAVDCDDPRPFRNAVLALSAGRRPFRLLDRLQGVERRMGRVRTGRPNEPRVIDLDLLTMGPYRLCRPRLVLPHPRMWQRRFVLAPLAEIEPGLRHPETGEPITAVIERLREAEPAVERVGPLTLL